MLFDFNLRYEQNNGNFWFYFFIFSSLGMDMGYGGNPYGPAGTGKTESVKALG